MPRKGKTRQPRPETDEERSRRIDRGLAALLKDKDARMRLWMACGAPSDELGEELVD